MRILVWMHRDILYIIEMIEKYLSDPRIDHYKATKLFDICRGHNILCSYKGIRLVGGHWLPDFVLIRCQDSCKSTPSNVNLLVEGAISWKSAMHTLTVALMAGAKIVAYYKTPDHEIYGSRIAAILGCDS